MNQTQPTKMHARSIHQGSNGKARNSFGIANVTSAAAAISAEELRHCFEWADIIGGSDYGERDDSAKQSSQMVRVRELWLDDRGDEYNRDRGANDTNAPALGSRRAMRRARVRLHDRIADKSAPQNEDETITDTGGHNRKQRELAQIRRKIAAANGTHSAFVFPLSRCAGASTEFVSPTPATFRVQSTVSRPIAPAEKLSTAKRGPEARRLHKLPDRIS